SSIVVAGLAVSTGGGLPPGSRFPGYSLARKVSAPGLRGQYQLSERWLGVEADFPVAAAGKEAAQDESEQLGLVRAPYRGTSEVPRPPVQGLGHDDYFRLPIVRSFDSAIFSARPSLRAAPGARERQCGIGSAL